VLLVLGGKLKRSDIRLMGVLLVGIPDKSLHIRLRDKSYEDESRQQGERSGLLVDVAGDPGVDVGKTSAEKLPGRCLITRITRTKRSFLLLNNRNIPSTSYIIFNVFVEAGRGFV
jgi:hypothetical protein